MGIESFLESAQSGSRESTRPPPPHPLPPSGLAAEVPVHKPGRCPGARIVWLKTLVLQPSTPHPWAP